MLLVWLFVFLVSLTLHILQVLYRFLVSLAPATVNDILFVTAGR